MSNEGSENLIIHLKKFRDLSLQGAVRDKATKEALEAYSLGMDRVIKRAEYFINVYGHGYGEHNYV